MRNHLHTALERQLRMRSDEHLCAIHDQPGERTAAVAAFVSAGLAAGARCIVAGPGVCDADLTLALGERGVDTAAALARGALILDEDGAVTGDLTDLSNLEAAQAQALARGYSGLRVARGPGPLDDEATIVAAERRLAARSAGGAKVLCCHARQSASATVLREALRCHATAILGSEVCANLYFEPPALGDAGDDERVAWMIGRLRGARQSEQRLEEAVGERDLVLGELAAERRRLELILRQLPAGVIIAEAPSGRVLLSNDQANELLDGGSLPEDWPLARTLRTGEAVLEEEIVVAREGRDTRTLVASSAPIHTDDHRMVAAVVSFLDLSEHRRAERSRDDALAEAQAAVRVRDEFLSIASHELKTPLSTMELQLTSVLRQLARAPEGISSALVGERLSILSRQVRRLTRLVDELLDVSRISAGRLDMNLEEMDLAAVARETVGRFREEAQRAECVLSLRVLSDGPDCVGRWDRLRVEQVIANLLSNALKYGRGHAIDVSVAGSEQGARLTVRDHGIGILPEDQARIFQRFERAVSERHYGGLGLGLWIVGRILEALGGRISVVSRPGEGAEFTVDLPSVPLEEQAAPIEVSLAGGVRA